MVDGHGADETALSGGATAPAAAPVVLAEAEGGATKESAESGGGGGGCGDSAASPADAMATSASTAAAARSSAEASGLHLNDSDEDERSHTFRRRRLTYTKHHLESAAAAAAAALEGLDDSSDEEGKQEEEEEAGGGNEKVVATKNGDHDQVQDGTEDAPSKPHQENTCRVDGAKEEGEDEDEGEEESPPRKRAKLTPRVLHASAPPRKLRDERSRLYQHQQSADANENAAAHAAATAHGGEVPAWRKRRFVRHSIHEDAELLPFPRDVVGTYSCHGVEPLYDSDYEHANGTDEDDDDAGVSDEDIKGAAPTSGPDASNTVAKINQDRGGVAFPYGNCPRTALFAAYDGHGEGGETVAQYALHEVQRRLEIHPDFADNVAKAFRDTFVDVDDDLRDVPEIEPLYAGATACVVLLRERLLTIANAGDSRAVLARRTKEEVTDKDAASISASPDGTTATKTMAAAASAKKRSAIDLSVDQNPDSPGEQERIVAAGGYVSPPPEPGLSARVWLDQNYSQIGLAMSRSIGDHAVKPVGVIADPVVTTHELMDEDEFMIIATDGVWEFVESAEAVDIVAKHLDAGEGASRACQCLIESAAAKWHDYEGDYRDDITALVVTFKGIWDHHSLVD